MKKPIWSSKLYCIYLLYITKYVLASDDPQSASRRPSIEVYRMTIETDSVAIKRVRHSSNSVVIQIWTTGGFVKHDMT